MRTRRLLLLALTLVLALYQFNGAVQPALASGTITISTSDFVVTIGNGGGLQTWQAQSITALSGIVTQLTISLSSSVGSPTGTMTWEIRNDSSNSPGTIIASGTFTPVASSSNVIPIGSGPTLTGGTKYWIVFHATTPQLPSNFWRGFCSSASIYSGGQRSRSFDSGSTWQSQSDDLDMSITTVDPTPTPTNTLTPSNTPTPTYTPSDTPTPTFTPTDTFTPSNTPTPTFTPTDTFTPSNTPTDTLTPSDTPTETFTPSNTPTDTSTPTDTPTSTSTGTLTPSNTPTPTFTPTNTPTPTYDLYEYATLEDGQETAVHYVIPVDEALIVMDYLILIGLVVAALIFGSSRLR